MAHFDASSPRTPAPRPHPPRLQHSPSLPNLWLPPRDGPIPPHVSRSPTTSHTSTSDLPHFSPLDLPSSLKPNTRQPSRLSNDLSRKSHKSHYLTPPLTPSSSLKSDSTDPEASNSSDSHEKIDAQKDKVATKSNSGQVSQSRFLILQNVPKDVPEDVLRARLSVIASSCDTMEPASEGEANLLRNQSASIPNKSGADQVIQTIIFSYRDKCTVILSLYDYRKAKRMKSLIDERRHISAVEGKGKDKQKARTKNNKDGWFGWDEDLDCVFLAPRDLAELIDQSGSSFKPLYDSGFVLSVSEPEAASRRGHTDGFAVEKLHLPTHIRVQSILSAHGDLCLFRFIRGDDHHQLFLVDYYDIRATKSAWNDLDNRVIENVKFSLINRSRLGEGVAKDLDGEAKKFLQELHFRDDYPAEAKNPAATRYTAPSTTSNKDTNHTHSTTDVPDVSEFHADTEYPQAAGIRSHKGTANTDSRRNSDNKASSSAFRGLESTPSAPSTPRRPSIPDATPRMAYSGGPSVTGRRSSSYHYPDAMQRVPVDGQPGGYSHSRSVHLPFNNEYHSSLEDNSHMGGVEAPEVSPTVDPYHVTAGYYYGTEFHPSTAMEAAQSEGAWYYSRDASSAQAHHHPAVVNYSLVSPQSAAPMYWDPWAWMHPDHMPNHREEWAPNLLQPTHHGYPQHQMYNYPYPVPPQHPAPVYPPPPHSVPPYFVQPPRVEPHPHSRPPASSSAISERNQLDIRRLENGSDTRTTVMVKNIPNKMTDKELIAYIDKVCHRRIDFLYLRMDFQNGCNVGYAFVNFITVQDLELFAKSRLGKKWNMYSSEKVLHMSYANYQGKEALVEKFKNSCIMDEIEDWRPKIFYSSGPNQGLPEPFPKPTHIRRKERSSYNRGALFVPGIHASSNHRKSYLNSNSLQQRAPSQRSQTDGNHRRRDSYDKNDYYETEREDDDEEGRGR